MKRFLVSRENVEYPLFKNMSVTKRNVFSVKKIVHFEFKKMFRFLQTLFYFLINI